MTLLRHCTVNTHTHEYVFTRSWVKKNTWVQYTSTCSVLNFKSKMHLKIMWTVNTISWAVRRRAASSGRKNYLHPFYANPISQRERIIHEVSFRYTSFDNQHPFALSVSEWVCVLCKISPAKEKKKWNYNTTRRKKKQRTFLLNKI